MKFSIFLIKKKVFGAWIRGSWGVILLKMGSWGSWPALGAFFGPVSSFSKRNKKSLIFLIKNWLFGSWLRGSWQGILRNRALASAPCTFLHSIVLTSKSRFSFYLVKHRVPGACRRGAFEANFRNRTLASARCIFLYNKKRCDFRVKCRIIVFPSKNRVSGAWRRGFCPGIS